MRENSFLLVTGETGSGKTTQLPQYLHHAGRLKFTVTALFNQDELKHRIRQENTRDAVSVFGVLNWKDYQN